MIVPHIPEGQLPALDEQVTAIKTPVHVDHLPGNRMIAGCLPTKGIIISIQDSHGHKTLVFSGSAPHYGEGGFETVVTDDGKYVVSIEGEEIEVEVMGGTAFLSWCGT